MTPAEIEAVLQLAFIQCEALLCPLTKQQKQILLRVLTELVTSKSLQSSTDADPDREAANPLDELTPQELGLLLQFVKEQEEQDRSWKIELLNDWLYNRDSESVQFLRDKYGIQWLSRIKPVHLAQYLAYPSIFLFLLVNR